MSTVHCHSCGTEIPKHAANVQKSGPMDQPEYLCDDCVDQGRPHETDPYGEFGGI